MTCDSSSFSSTASNSATSSPSTNGSNRSRASDASALQFVGDGKRYVFNPYAQASSPTVDGSMRSSAAGSTGHRTPTAEGCVPFVADQQQFLNAHTAPYAADESPYAQPEQPQFQFQNQLPQYPPPPPAARDQWIVIGQLPALMPLMDRVHLVHMVTGVRAIAGSVVTSRRIPGASNAAGGAGGHVLNGYSVSTGCVKLLIAGQDWARFEERVHALRATRVCGASCADDDAKCIWQLSRRPTAAGNRPEPAGWLRSVAPHVEMQGADSAVHVAANPMTVELADKVPHSDQVTVIPPAPARM